MNICKKCNKDKVESDFYNSDSTCKECRKAMVRANRAKNIEYYRGYDKKRFKDDPRVKARHARYAASESGKAAAKRAKEKYIELNPIKRAAHIMVGNAVRDGKIIKGVCEVCGDLDSHGHHDDYSLPLVVRWLCSIHHSDWHAKNGEGANAR